MADETPGDSVPAVALQLMKYVQEVTSRMSGGQVETTPDGILQLYHRCYRVAGGRGAS